MREESGVSQNPLSVALWPQPFLAWLSLYEQPISCEEAHIFAIYFGTLHSASSNFPYSHIGAYAYEGAYEGGEAIMAPKLHTVYRHCLNVRAELN